MLLEYRKEMCRVRISMEMSKGAYEIAKRVYEDQITFSEAKLLIHRETNMAEGSAHIFILIFLAMMEGKEYKRAFNNSTNEFLINKIREDFGEKYYQKALEAAQKHVDYYSTLGRGNLRGLQEIINRNKSK